MLRSLSNMRMCCLGSPEVSRRTPRRPAVAPRTVMTLPLPRVSMASPSGSPPHIAQASLAASGGMMGDEAGQEHAAPAPPASAGDLLPPVTGPPEGTAGSRSENSRAAATESSSSDSLGCNGSGEGHTAGTDAPVVVPPAHQPRGGTALHDLVVRLDGLSAKYQQLDDRLDALERALVEIYKQRRRDAGSRKNASNPGGGAGSSQPADDMLTDRTKEMAGSEAGAGVAPLGSSSGKTAAGRGGSSNAAPHADAPSSAPSLPPAERTASSLTNESTGVGGDPSSDSEGEGFVGGGLVFDISKLQSSVVETLNSGHLESIKTLRETLMAHEWELHSKRLAMHRGVANFEHYVALQKLDVDYGAVTKLYQDPSDLTVLPDNHIRLMARSMIEQAVDERYQDIYQQCTAAAKELANMSMTSRLPIPVPGAGAMSGVAGVVRSIAGGLGLGK